MYFLFQLLYSSDLFGSLLYFLTFYWCSPSLSSSIPLWSVESSLWLFFWILCQANYLSQFPGILVFFFFNLFVLFCLFSPPGEFFVVIPSFKRYSSAFSFCLTFYVYLYELVCLSQSWKSGLIYINRFCVLGGFGMPVGTKQVLMVSGTTGLLS